MISEVQGIYSGISNKNELTSNQSSLNITFEKTIPRHSNKTDWMKLKVGLPDKTINVYVRIDDLMKRLKISDSETKEEVLALTKYDHHYLQKLFLDDLVDNLGDKPQAIDRYTMDFFKFTQSLLLCDAHKFNPTESKFLTDFAVELITKFIRLNPNAINKKINPSALRAVAFMVGEKIIHDNPYNNKSYAGQFLMPIEQLNEVEVYFVNGLHWDLQPSDELRARYPTII